MTKITTEDETLVPIWVKPTTKEIVVREKHKRSIEASKTITFDQLLLEKFKGNNK